MNEIKMPIIVLRRLSAGECTRSKWYKLYWAYINAFVYCLFVN